MEYRRQSADQRHPDSGKAIGSRIYSFYAERLAKVVCMTADSFMLGQQFEDCPVNLGISYVDCRLYGATQFTLLKLFLMYLFSYCFYLY
jgi:hypothetical protein